MWQSNRTIRKEKINQLDLETRVRVEAQITDARAMALDVTRLASLDTRLSAYAAHSAWRRYLFNWLGPVQGKVLLDIACGYSMTPVIFALAGADVYAVDVAPQAIATVQRFAAAKGVADRVHLHVGPIETLPFEPAQFDLNLWRCGLASFATGSCRSRIRARPQAERERCLSRSTRPQISSSSSPATISPTTASIPRKAQIIRSGCMDCCVRTAF